MSRTTLGCSLVALSSVPWRHWRPRRRPKAPSRARSATPSSSPTADAARCCGSTPRASSSGSATRPTPTTAAWPRTETWSSPAASRGRTTASARSPDRKVVWEYKTTGEVFSCQRLADGNTLVGESTNARLVESRPTEDRQGDQAQGPARRPRRAPHGPQDERGHLHLRPSRRRHGREYAASGEVLREIKGSRPAYGALRLENSHVLFSCEHHVIEVDAEGKRFGGYRTRTCPRSAQVARLHRAAAQRQHRGRNWLGHGQEGKRRAPLRGHARQESRLAIHRREDNAERDRVRHPRSGMNAAARSPAASYASPARNSRTTT